MPNFQNRAAFGDIYTLPTSTVDGLANRLYQEQKLREAKQQQDIKGMDDMFARNVSGVRDEDIPEIAESYNKWKTAKMNLYRNPKSKNRIQEELAAQREMANTFQQIGNSKQMLKSIQDNGKRVAAKPDDHTDDAASLIAMTNGVPTSKFGTLLRPDPNGDIDPVTGKVKMVSFDPSDYNSYVDRGNVKNWQPIMKNAIGALKDVTPVSEDYKDDKGLVLGQKVTPIKATASPTSYMANMSQYVYSGVGRLKHFTNSFKDSYTDENATKIAAEYYDQAKNNPLWKQAWGENGVAIPPEALANPNTRVLALNSMEYALNNPPQLGTPRNVPNVANVKKSDRNYSEGEFDRRQRIRTRDSLIKIAANKPGGSGVETTGNALDEFGVVTDLSLQSGGKISKGLVYDKSGNAYNGELAVKKEWLPANVTVSLSAAKIPLKNVMNVKVKDGVIQSIMTPNGEVSRQAMENLQKKANTEPIKAPQPVFGNPTKKVEQPAPKKETPANKPVVKAAEYKKADLKANGWTDEQIDKAVKAGKIKVN